MRILKRKKKRNQGISPLMIMKCTDKLSFHSFLCTALQFCIFFYCCNLQFVEFLQAVQVEGCSAVPFVSLLCSMWGVEERVMNAEATASGMQRPAEN